MLTPSELLNGTSQTFFPGSRLENNNIDIHIHTFVNSPTNSLNLPENTANQSFFNFLVEFLFDF